MAHPATSLTADQKRYLLATLLKESASTPDPEWPLSFAQERFWFLEQLEPDGAPHVLHLALRLRGPIDRAALDRAFSTVVERHEVLRTVYTLRQGEPRQVVRPPAPAKAEYLDLAGADAALESTLARLARHRFDLTREVIRLHLLRLADTDHVLMPVVHHVACDGVSLRLFLSELASAYDHEVTGAPAALPDLPVQYADFAVWQRERFATGDDADLGYWKARLAGLPPPLELPADRARPARQVFAGGSVWISLPAPAIAAARHLAAAQGTTFFTVLLSVLATLLHRYSGQDDFCIGVPAGARPQVETEPLIGLFINTLPIRFELSGNPPVTDLLGAAREALVDAQAHQDVPFERIMEEVNPPRSLAHSPIFQVMATSVRAPRGSRFGPLDVVPCDTVTPSTPFDLTVYFVQRTDEHWTLWFDYQTALFDEDRIRRMADHFVRLLNAAVADPTRPIGELPLLTAAEQQQLDRWNGTAAPVPDGCVHDLVRAQAARTPSAMAVECGTRAITYAELDARSDHLAARLAARGAGPGARVAVLVGRGIDLVVALLAVAKTGAAYVPMDPAYPLDRLAYMLEDSGAAVLLTARGLMPALEAKAPVVEDAGTGPGSPAPPAPLPVDQHDPASLAYVIYTSGSTGRPKGVAVTHRGLVNLLAAMQREPGLTARDTLMAVTTVCFDIAGLELFLPLITGARLVVAEPEMVADGRRLHEALRTAGATAMQATPSTWRLLLAAGWNGTNPPLRVLCGGEALPPDLAGQLVVASREVWNLYGPTETTIWSSRKRLGRDGAITIGRPIENTTFAVLDRRLQPVPIGVPGELFIGGAGVADGYWGRPDLTAERFMVREDGRGGRSRWYRTGDEVRLLPSGEYEYLRRLDAQVKIRGYRIELGEIEHALARVPGVAEAAVIVREDVPGDRRLAGYVVPAPGAALRARAVQEALRATLPDYMVPFIVALPALPLTANGKIDRKALPAPTVAAEVRAAIRPARDPVEATLVDIWQAALGLSPIGVRDDFFALGGHSLLAVRVFDRMAAELGVTLPLATLFHQPTIEHLASCIRDRRAGIEAPAIQALAARGSRPPFFAAGSDPVYGALSRLLGDDQPFYRMDLYALTERLVTSGQAPYATFEEYVRVFVRDIRRVQPSGPYHLGGGCDGGVLALEIARTLQAEGEPIGLLVVWDTPRTGFFEPTVWRTARHFVRRAGRALIRGELTSRLGDRLRRGRDPVPSASPREAQHWQIYDAYWNAIRRFRSTRRFEGRIQFIQAAEQYEQYRPTPTGWGDLATDGVDIHVVPGDHMTYAREHLPVFAETLGRLLARAQRKRACPI